MKTTELTVTRVGNSRGVRIPADVLRRYRVGDTLLMEQRPDEIVLRPKRTRQQKLNWAETYQQMAQTDEDWSDWESLTEGMTAATVQGATVTFTLEGGAKVNDATITAADIAASNGVIHVIDKVIMPPAN